MCLDLFGSVVSVMKKLKFLTGGEKALEINRDEVYYIHVRLHGWLITSANRFVWFIGVYFKSVP